MSERPSADGVSIPSSVDPDADPLGECSECGATSRRAYSKDLCPDCASERSVDLDGCPVCDWDGQVAETHDHNHRYYTHVVVKDGELLKGRTCSERTRPKKRGLVERTAEALRLNLL
jgi:hypothetical protein